jgi:Domain of unknown function (DUF1707)/Domain of unknown function (DUF4234)
MTTARHLRVSDAERQVAAQRIGAAWAEGRLDDAEYDRRLAQAFAAVTYGDLDELFTDLPGPRPVQPPPQYGPPSVAYRPMPGVPAAVRNWCQVGAVGQVRTTGLQMLLFVVTFGIWGYVYFFQTHDEMKRHTGDGIGGVLALLLAVLFWMASPFLLSHEVGRLYERRGQRKPVSALTGLWFFPGIFLLVGPVIWFVLTNRALNAHWRSLGAR